jgi:hypothetical protein
LGKLFARLLFLKNTSWGARTDLDIHRSYRERSMVPYILLSLLQYWPQGRAATLLSYTGLHRHEIIGGCSTSNRDNPLSPIADHLERSLVAVRPFLRDPAR